MLLRSDGAGIRATALRAQSSFASFQCRYRDLSGFVAQMVPAIQHPLSEPAKRRERMSREW